MYRNIYHILFLIVCLVATMAVPAATIDHRLGVSAEGGYAINIYTNSDARSHGGVGAFGGVYEMQYRQFLFHLVVSAQYEGMHFNMSNQQVDIANVEDEVGDVGTRHYYLNSIQTIDRIVMPCMSVMAGGTWSNFYFLVGGKIGADVFHLQTNQTTYTVTATYPFFDTELGDLPQHALVTDVLYQNKRKMSTISPSVRAGAEVGVGVSLGKHSSAPLLRIGAFGEYTIPLAADYQPQLIMSQADYTGIAYNELSTHVLSRFDQSLSNSMQHSQWSRLTVGLRCTILFNVGSSIRRNCMCMD